MSNSRNLVIFGTVTAVCLLAGGLTFTNNGQVGGWATGANDAAGCAGGPQAVEESPDSVQIVRTAYDQLEYYVPGNLDLNFEISDVQSIQAVHFTTELWVDWVSPQDGERIRMKRDLKVNRFNDGERFEQVKYIPDWHTPEDLSPKIKENEELSVENMSFAEVFAAAAEHVPEAKDITRVTSYSVTAKLGDKTREYRAAFLWLGPEKNSEFLVVDNITLGVAAAAAESRPREFASGLADRLSTMVRSKDDGPATNPDDDGSGEGSCVLNKEDTDEMRKERTTGHVFGYDVGEADLKVECACDADCYCDADATVENTACEPRGAVHMPSSWSECFTEDSFEDHVLAPNSCGANAAYACGISSCPFGIGAGSVTIEADGVGSIKFDWKGVDIAKWKAQTSINCECNDESTDAEPAVLEEKH